jgi:hypothetical protein
MAAGELATAACAGKTFEHHVRMELADWQTWRCPDCGTTSSIKDISDRVARLVMQAEDIRVRTARIPVILMPSESAPGLIGQFYGYDLYRVQGISRPMVAIS